jgi:hypothetical protein
VRKPYEFAHIAGRRSASSLQEDAPGWTIGTAQATERQSPKRTVAGALKKLFRMSESKSSNEHEAQTPPHQPAGKLQHRAGDAPRQQQHHIRDPPPDNPASILDDDDRLTDRTGTFDRTSAITDRSSTLSAAAVPHVVVMDRASSGQPIQQQPSGGLVRMPSRNSNGSSRLTSYIRSIIKSSSTNTHQQHTTTAAAAAAAVAAMPQPAPHQQQQQVAGIHTPSPPPASQLPPPRLPSPAVASTASASASPTRVAYTPPAASSPSAAFVNLPRSPVSSPHVVVPPPGSPAANEYLGLPLPSEGALLRMQRDPNLLTVCNDLPPLMDRPAWRVEDYTLQTKVHAGYASAVYKAHCK